MVLLLANHKILCYYSNCNQDRVYFYCIETYLKQK